MSEVLLSGLFHLEKVAKSSRVKGTKSLLLVKYVQGDHRPVRIWIDLNWSQLIVLADPNQKKVKG